MIITCQIQTHCMIFACQIHTHCMIFTCQRHIIWLCLIPAAQFQTCCLISSCHIQTCCMIRKIIMPVFTADRGVDAIRTRQVCMTEPWWLCLIQGPFCLCMTLTGTCIQRALAVTGRTRSWLRIAQIEGSKLPENLWSGKVQASRAVDLGRPTRPAAQVLLKWSFVCVLGPARLALKVLDVGVRGHVAVHVSGLLEALATHRAVHIEHILVLGTLMEEQPLSRPITLATDLTCQRQTVWTTLCLEEGVLGTSGCHVHMSFPALRASQTRVGEVERLLHSHGQAGCFSLCCKPIWKRRNASSDLW